MIAIATADLLAQKCPFDCNFLSPKAKLYGSYWHLIH